VVFPGGAALNRPEICHIEPSAAPQFALSTKIDGVSCLAPVIAGANLPKVSRAHHKFLDAVIDARRSVTA